MGLPHTNFEAGYGIPTTAGSQLEEDLNALQGRFTEAISLLELVQSGYHPYRLIEEFLTKLD